jgi:hypothetical protein
MGSLAHSGRRDAPDEYADSRRLRDLLCLYDERCESETKSENDREPDPPHGHLGGDGWRGV